MLRANSHGWYAACQNAAIWNPNENIYDKPDLTPTVCFTESTLAGLKAHRDIFCSNYGIAFDRDDMYDFGANPCINIRSEELYGRVKSCRRRYGNVFNHIPSPLHPYINIINEAFDATHEREWRIKNNFGFEYADVLLVFCPEKDFRSSQEFR